VDDEMDEAVTPAVVTADVEPERKKASVSQLQTFELPWGLQHHVLALGSHCVNPPASSATNPCEISFVTLNVAIRSRSHCSKFFES
jgi:hypothetical protein